MRGAISERERREDYLKYSGRRGRGSTGMSRKRPLSSSYTWPAPEVASVAQSLLALPSAKAKEASSLLLKVASANPPEDGADAAGAAGAAGAEGAAGAAGESSSDHGCATEENLLKMAWDALHTGHWSRVDPPWRAAYMVAALMASKARWDRDGDAAASECLRMVDLGLMLGDHTFRGELLAAATFLEEVLTCGSEALPSAASGASASGASTSSASSAPACAAIGHATVSSSAIEPRVPVSAATPRPLSGSIPAVRRLRLPSLAYFFNECMAPSRPCVLTGVIDGWPARTERPWADLDYLKRAAGHRTVPVEVGDTYLDARFDETLMTLGDFIDRHVRSSPPRERGLCVFGVLAT